jgi:Protein of unknown function (DUF3131)
MGMSRRSLLLGSLSLPTLLACRDETVAAQSWSRPAMIVLTGIDLSSNPEHLAKVLQPFMLRKMPITASIDVGRGSEDQSDGASAALGLLKHMAAKEPNLLEVAIDLGAILVPDPYFQLRLASDAVSKLNHLMTTNEPMLSQVASGLTATTSTPVRFQEDLAGMRGAGLRTVLHLTDEAASSGIQIDKGGYWMTKTGLVNVFGPKLMGAKALAADYASEVASELNGLRSLLGFEPQSIDPIIVRLRLEQLSTLGEAKLSRLIADIADALQNANMIQQIRLVLPTSLYRNSKREGARYVVVRVDDLGAPADADPDYQNFIASLLERSIPLTIVVDPARLALPSITAKHQNILNDSQLEFAMGGLDEVSGNATHPSLTTYTQRVRLAAQQLFATTGKTSSGFVTKMNDFTLLEAAASVGISMVTTGGDGPTLALGMDRLGLLHAASTVNIEIEQLSSASNTSVDSLLTRIGDFNDVVLAINPGNTNTLEKKHWIGEILDRLVVQQGTSLTSTAGYYNKVVPRMAELELIRYAKTQVRTLEPVARPVDAQLESQLLTDAALAWEFFDWSAAMFNGMAAGTGWEEYGHRAGYPFTTQWDVGSYVLATVSAHFLKVINQAKFERIITTILNFVGLSSYRFRGVRLPNVEMALGPTKPKGRGFDCADTGRLLIALKVLENYAPTTFPIAKLIAGWGLKNIIIDGVLYSVSNGKIVVVPYNSYSHYAREGYLAWGMDVVPVYDDVPLDMDGAVRFLNIVGIRGRIATEPTVTEEIETGGNEQTRLVADVLYAAQIRRFRETGIITCRSEGPIDGPPYFTYQGYQLKPDGGEFVVDGRTLKQKEQIGDNWPMVSTKGCFLWYAARPGEYADKLVELARETARIDGLGFASGIHEGTGQATALTDVNTNGLILESIAYILHGRTPLNALGRSAAATE